MDTKNINFPNILTAFRIILIPVVSAAFAEGNIGVATILFLIASATDIFDGFIARRFNLVTDVGKVLDPIADKGMSLTVLICMWKYAELIPNWAVVIFIAKEAAMLMGGMILLVRKDIVPSVWYGKASTIITSTVVVVILLWRNVITDDGRLLLITFAATFAIFALYMYAVTFIRRLK